MAQGDLALALRSFTESKTIRERLSASRPAHAAWQRDLWVSYGEAGGSQREERHAADAQGWWKTAYDPLAGMNFDRTTTTACA